jgi:hypothetical protein
MMDSRFLGELYKSFLLSIDPGSGLHGTVASACKAAPQTRTPRFFFQHHQSLAGPLSNQKPVIDHTVDPLHSMLQAHAPRQHCSQKDVWALGGIVSVRMISLSSHYGSHEAGLDQSKTSILS